MGYKVIIGGSRGARLDWKSGEHVYKHKRSAKRRQRQISKSRDIRVSTVWVIPVYR